MVCITKYVTYDRAAPKIIVFVKLISKLSALEKIIFILDQTINGIQNNIWYVYSDTISNSSPSKDMKMVLPKSLNMKYIIGIRKEAKNTFSNFDLIEFTSLFSLAFESSGNRISKLAAKSWKIISKILLDQANTPRTDPE